LNRLTLKISLSLLLRVIKQRKPTDRTPNFLFT